MVLILVGFYFVTNDGNNLAQIVAQDQIPDIYGQSICKDSGIGLRSIEFQFDCFFKDGELHTLVRVRLKLSQWLSAKYRNAFGIDYQHTYINLWIKLMAAILFINP